MLKIQKALHLHLDEAKKKPAHVGETYAIMEKYDGWYMYIDCIAGVWQPIKSKAHRVLPSMAHYSALFETSVTPSKVDVRLVFETTLEEASTGDPMIFSKLNGLFNQKKVALKEGAVVDSKTFGKVTIQGLKLRCHDLIVLDNLDRPFQQRYIDLHKFLCGSDAYQLDFIRRVPVLETTSDTKRWYAIYEEIIAKYGSQGEGIIGKRVDAGYSPDKRNADVFKIKCEKTFELRVTGVREGEGKYKGMLGKLVVTDACGNHNEVSGMDDELRQIWWDNPSLIIGKIVEVMCMKVLPNKSLREGRYKAVRFDKDYPDEL